MTGFSKTSSVQKDILIMKVDLTGSIVWCKIYGGLRDDEATNVINTYDGGFALTGITSSFSSAGTDSINAFIMKLDALGNINWTRVLGGSSEDAGNALVQAADSGFVMAGFTKSFGSGNRDVLISRTDKNGNLIWQKAFGGSAAETGNAICRTSSDNYLITGSTGITSTQNIILCMYVNSSGNLIWEKTYDFTLSASNVQRIGYDVIENNNKQFLVAGKVGQGTINDAQPFLMNIDSTGATVNWTRSYTLNSGDGSAHAVRLLPNGGYILGGTMGNYVPALIKVNGSGVRQWSYYYGSISGSGILGYGYSLAQSADMGFALTGYFSPGATNDTAAVLIKTDSLGNSSCNFSNTFGSGTNTLTTIVGQITSTLVSGGTSFSITPMLASPTTTTITYCTTVGTKITEKNQVDLQPVPNPFNVDTYIRFDKDVVDAEIALYDIFGKKIKTISSVSGKEYKLMRENLNAGIYFLILKQTGIISAPLKLLVTD